jgi:hypothetical protein
VNGEWEADLIREAHPDAEVERVAGCRWRARAYGRTVTSTLPVIRVTLDRWKAWQQVARICRAYAGRP